MPSTGWRGTNFAVRALRVLLFYVSVKRWVAQISLRTVAAFEITALYVILRATLALASAFVLLTVVIVAIVIPAIALRLTASHDLQLILVVHWCADHVVRHSWVDTSWMLAAARLPMQHHILHIVVSHLVELLVGGVVPVAVPIGGLLVHLVLWLHHT